MDFFSKVLFNIDIAAGIKAIIKRIRKPADEVFEVIFRWLRKKVNKFRKKGKKGKDEKKETKEESKKDMKEGKNNKLTKKDKAMHRKLLKDIHKKITEPAPDKEKDFQSFLKDKQKQAKKLENETDSKLKKGIKTSIKLIPSRDKQKGEKIIFKSKIAPNTSTDEGEILYEDEDVKIQRIIFVHNKKVDMDKGKYNEAIASKLKDILASFEKGSAKRKRQAIRFIRSEEHWEEHQGGIYIPFIKEQQDAVNQLKTKAKGDYILSFETGGTLGGDEIITDTNIQHIKIRKAESNHHQQQPRELIEAITKLMEAKYKNYPTVILNISETVMSGSATNNMLNLGIKPILSKYPNLQINLLLLRETLKFDEKEGKGIEKKIASNAKYLMEKGQIEIVLGRTSFVLGEDVDRYKKYESKQPVMVFKGNQKQIVAYRIIPQGNTSSRDIIIGLATKKYNDKAPELFR